MGSVYTASRHGTVGNHHEYGIGHMRYMDEVQSVPRKKNGVEVEEGVSLLCILSDSKSLFSGRLYNVICTFITINALLYITFHISFAQASLT